MGGTSRIGPRLYVGIAPPPGPALRKLGWDVLVLCAEEYQPFPQEFPGLEVIRAPNDDADRRPTLKEKDLARDAGIRAAARVREGKRVLVTCMQGRNRSGLVAAIALHYLTGASGEACARKVKAMREGALSNPHFVRELRAMFPEEPRRAWREAVYL